MRPRHCCWRFLLDCGPRAREDTGRRTRCLQKLDSCELPLFAQTDLHVSIGQAVLLPCKQRCLVAAVQFLPIALFSGAPSTGCAVPFHSHHTANADQGD